MAKTMARDESKGVRTDASRTVEALLRRARFDKVAAYEWSGSIRVVVGSDEFLGLDDGGRESLISPHLRHLPREVEDVVYLAAALTLAEWDYDFECCNGAYTERWAAQRRRDALDEFQRLQPPDGDDGEVTNADRRRWARAALEAYMAARGTAEDGCRQAQVQDLITDLLHLFDEVRENDEPAENAGESAIRDYLGEREEVEDSEDDVTCRE